MNPRVFRLLKGFLARNFGLYMVLGLTQFLMTSVYWTFGYERVPLPGVLLGMLGAAGVISIDSLVWRSLPLKTRDAGVFRWWTATGLPGLFLTLFAGADWAAHHSGGLNSPGAPRVLEGILVTWAALGLFAALPPGTAGIGRGLRALNAKTLSMGGPFRNCTRLWIASRSCRAALLCRVHMPRGRASTALRSEGAAR